MGVGWCGARFSKRGEALDAERAVLNTFFFPCFFLHVGRWSGGERFKGFDLISRDGVLVF